MKAIGDIKSLLSFLTRIPIEHSSLEQAAKSAYLFPLIGLIIGAWAALVAYASFYLFPSEVAAIITVIALYAFTGLLHLDGLADFFDGVMAKGNKERKYAAMKDINIGIAGVFSAISVFLLLITSVYAIEKMHGIMSLCKALMISEISSKLSMNTCIIAGKKSTEGMGSMFIENASLKGYYMALAIATVLGLICSCYRFLFVYTGIFVALIIVRTAHTNFGYVTGDAIGASNEISRAITLLLWSFGG